MVVLARRGFDVAEIEAPPVAGECKAPTTLELTYLERLISPASPRHHDLPRYCIRIRATSMAGCY